MEYLKALSPTLLMVLGGIITWIIKSKIEELHAIQEKLREERRNTYAQILDPYIRLFSDIKGKGAEKALKEVASYDYKKTAFNLNLFGSDEVVLAYNNLIKHSYEVEVTGEKNPGKMMSLWGILLLEIRKSLGNKDTKLEKYDMLRAMIKDIDKFKE